MTFQPPAYCFRKAADGKIKRIVVRYIIDYRDMCVKYLAEILFQIAKEYLAALSAEQSSDALLFFLQMIEDMCYPVPEGAVV